MFWAVQVTVNLPAVVPPENDPGLVVQVPVDPVGAEPLAISVLE